jgi:hypothetical protein
LCNKFFLSIGSAIQNRLSVISDQLSVISYQCSVISYIRLGAIL